MNINRALAKQAFGVENTFWYRKATVILELDLCNQFLGHETNLEW
jgi:hypothetical protein